jgi:hypothetical protein
VSVVVAVVLLVVTWKEIDMTTRSRAPASVPWLVACFLLVPSLALAGPNAGGTLILHANPSIVFTSDTQNYCGLSALDSCSTAVTSVEWDPGKHVVFHAIAAFPSGSSPRLKGLSFGIDYDPTKFVMAARGTCADFEISDGGWPAPGTGTAQSWTTGTRTGLLTECYWFVGYAYSEQEGEDSTSVALIPHPMQHGIFVDDAFPAEVDTIAGYGRLGFGRPGYIPCSNPVDSGQSTDEPDGRGEDDESNDSADDGHEDPQVTFAVDVTHPVVLYVDPGENDHVELGATLDPMLPDVMLHWAFTEALSGAAIDSFDRTLHPGVTDTLPSVRHIRTKGMAKLTITTSAGLQRIVGIAALGPGPGRDHLQFNDARIALRYAFQQSHPFWVPLWATHMRVSAVTSSSQQDPVLFDLVDADSSTVLGQAPTGATYEVDLSGHRRNARWHIYMEGHNNPSNTPVGILGVAFRRSGAPPGTWWSPTNAIAFESVDPPRMEFGPGELAQLDDSTTFLHPLVPHTLTSYGSGLPLLPSTALVYGDRQEFTITVPSGGAEVRLAHTGQPLIYDFWTPGWHSDPDTLQGEYQYATTSLEGHPDGSERLVRLSVYKGGGFWHLWSTAPVTMIGPSRAITFACPGYVAPYTSSIHWFYLPPGVDTVRIDLDVTNRCRDTNCPSPTYDRRRHIYPPMTLTLVDADGNWVDDVTGSNDNYGRTTLSYAVGAKRGQVWGFSVATGGSVYTGQKCTVTLGDSIPPYLSWRSPSDLRVPLATVPRIPFLITDAVPGRFPFLVSPSAETHLSRIRFTENGQPSDLVYRDRLPGVIYWKKWNHTPATRDRVGVAFSLWSDPDGPIGGAAPIEGVRVPCYLLQPPTRLTQEGLICSTSDTLGMPESYVALAGALPYGSCWVDFTSAECPRGFGEARDRGFTSCGVDLRVQDAPDSVALDRFVSIWGPAVTHRFPSSAEFADIESQTSSATGHPNMAGILLGDEPLSNLGLRLEDLWEVMYRARRGSATLPLCINEEPTLGNLRGLSDAVDIWLDDSYYMRGDAQDGPTPLCEYIGAIKDMRRADRPYRAEGMYQLAGWPEDGSYHGATPDSATCQSLAGLALGVGVQFQWLRFWSDGIDFLDLKQENESLWVAWGNTLSMLQKVSGYVTKPAVYGSGLTGSPTLECEYPPLAYRYGAWTEGPDSIGVYFVLANLDQVSSHTLVLSQAADLRLIPGTPTNLVLIGHSGTVSASNVQFQGQQVTFAVPAAGYIVGRLCQYSENAAVSVYEEPERLRLGVLGNPTSGPTILSVSGYPGGPLDVTVFDAAGREVQRLYRGVWRNRIGVLDWDGRDASGRNCGPGVYFVRARAIDNQTRTATVVRVP